MPISTSQYYYCCGTLECSQKTLDNWEIEHQFIELKGKLSDGVSNEIWAGMWNGITPVTVITLTPKPGLMAIFNFLAEAEIMKNLQHDKLIKLYGVHIREEPIYIVTELMKHGNLLDYLRNSEGQHLKLPELIDIGAQVANGMAYLESHHYIHRDLAARNVLVGEENIVKIGGFSLTRLLVDGKYSAKQGDKIPVRWTDPDVPINGFTIKSDVWSFGVFLNELVTRGRVPYPGMTNDEVLVQVNQGYRMPQPPGCPDPLYQMMLDCWKTDPKERPKFEHLMDQLEEYFEEVNALGKLHTFSYMDISNVRKLDLITLSPLATYVYAAQSVEFMRIYHIYIEQSAGADLGDSRGAVDPPREKF